MSKSSNISLGNVIREIEVAFSSNEYPGDDKLVYDNSGYHLECVGIATYFKGKHWKTIPLDKLRYHGASLYFFTPQAYHFYLPAYLIASIRDYAEVDMVSNYTVYSLTPPEDKEDEKSFLNRINGFNTSQKKAINSFIKLFIVEHSCDFELEDLKRLEDFWKR